MDIIMRVAETGMATAITVETATGTTVGTTVIIKTGLTADQA